MIVKKKYVLFVIVLILFTLLVIYRVMNPFVQPRVQKLTFTGKKNTKTHLVKEVKESGSGHKASQTGVSLFLNKPRISGKVYHDLFAIYRPPHKKKDNVLVKKEAQVQNVIKPIKKDPMAEIKRYIASYTLYGTYESENKKAVLLAKDKQVLVARIGDRIDGKYLIDDIQDNYIRIKALNLNETIQFDMREFNNE